MSHTTLVDATILLPKDHVQVELADDWSRCVGGVVDGPFAAFSPPAPGTVRRYRLRGVGASTQSPAAHHLEVRFSWVDAGPEAPVFSFPPFNAAGGSSVIHSDWYTFGDGSAGAAFGGSAVVEGRFVSGCPGDRPGLYALFLEAYDVPAG